MSIHMSIHMSKHMSTHMSIHMSIDMSIHMSIHVHMSTHMSTHMSIHMFPYAQDYAHVIHRHRHGQCCGVWAACAFFALVDQSVAPVETAPAPAGQRMHRHLVPPKGRLRNVIFVGHHHGRKPDLSGNVRMQYIYM